MTRVRHPTHIAFSPWPGLERVTSVIARKPALKQRKAHEATLRGLAQQTAARLGLPPLAHPDFTKQAGTPSGVTPRTGQAPKQGGQHSKPTPPSAAMGSLSEQKPAPPQAPSSAKTASSAASKACLVGQKRTQATAAIKAPVTAGSSVTGHKRPRPTVGTQAAAGVRMRQQEFDYNTGIVTSHGLPRLVVPARSPLAPAPSLPAALVAARAAGLRLEARIVDFWNGSQGTRAAIRSWLRDLGFHVTVTEDCAQVGRACGYVAARATNLMYAAGADFQSVNVSGAADESWINLGNEMLENGEVEACFLETQHVYTLTQLFRERAFPDEQDQWDIGQDAWPCMQWPLTVGSLDWGARMIVEALMGCINAGSNGSGEPLRSFFVINTQDCRQDGVHWISVAISMRWNDDSDS